MSENKNISVATHSDIVISTRVRLARNLREYPFPCRMNAQMADEIAKKVIDAINTCALASTIKDVDMQKISREDAISLAEGHLISPDFVNKGNGRHLLTDYNSLSIMINEEDHIRIQALSSGMDFNNAFSLADKVDTLLGEKLDFAYDDKLGYLTQCPTNLGTGMRASLMLHLPALHKTASVGRISNSLSKLGLVMRGSFGEGSEAKGALYQLSNQVTLGISEKTAIDNLCNVALQIINQERTAAKTIVKNIDIIDSIYRSVGALKNARLMSNDEAIAHISNVRLALGAGVLVCDDMSSERLNNLIVDIQPATLMKNAGKLMDTEDRDILRADILRKAFSTL